jgi:hypothetical protein
VVQGAEGEFETGARFPDHPVGGYPYLVEDEFSGGGSLDAEFSFLGAEGESLVCLLADEGR